MCGICGEYNFGSGRPAIPARIQRMAASITHRGPDDEGYVCRGSVALGFRRLSIIDLALGHQPMINEARGVYLVFNGEIYNFQELRTELQQLGHQFKTRCDTEVILNGYIQWGIDVLERLNGMFAIAIWDEQKDLLLLARDRMGIKPLYYWLTSDQVVFGSEIRVIQAHGEYQSEPDPAALNMFFRYRYTPSPLTAFKGIRKLAAGTRMVVEKGVPRVERWWNFSPKPLDRMPGAAEAQEHLVHLYRQAVKRQLMSDVPVGLFLSGGLDSGLLLALMSESHKDWDTYSVGFGGTFGNDELSAAADTARHFQALNHPTVLTRTDIEDALAKVVHAVEEPVAADSIVPMYYLCQRARQDVKVALMGQGPDELFGGYRRHLVARYGPYAKWLPSPARSVLKSAFKHVMDGASAARMAATIDARDEMQGIQAIFSQLPGSSAQNLFQDDLLATDTDDQVARCWQELEHLMPHTDQLADLQFLEIRSSLPDELLLYADKLSMAHSLEVRVPYLDHDVVEYVECLSASFKIRNGSRKWLHRKVCNQFMPAQFVKRKKIGFETPAGDWFRAGARGTTSDYLSDPESKLFQFLRPKAVASLLQEHRGGQFDHSDFLFSLVALEEWLRLTCNKNTQEQSAATL
jgi:asparagine synthase (glutamine-hydrolysing)